MSVVYINQAYILQHPTLNKYSKVVPLYCGLSNIHNALFGMSESEEIEISDYLLSH